MQNFFSVGEAAKAVGITSETLRHYDRIGLVTPSRKDDFTNYRYYTEQDLVRIQTVRALQQMDLPLQKIKEVLAFDELGKIIDFLAEAEKKADEKISQLQNSKAKIQLAKSGYESKFRGQRSTEGVAVKHFPERVILLSDTMETPSLENLWNYLSHFYNKIEQIQKEQFSFEDAAGIYTENGVSRLFAVCIRYGNTEGLKVLPKGNYLCADCAEEDRENKIRELLRAANEEYRIQPHFTVQQIIVSGILQWKYQAQVYIGS